jgi:hypothetical protein
VRFKIDAQQLLLPADHAQLDGGADRGILMQADIDPARRQQRCRLRPASSSPTTDSSATRAPSAAQLRATLAAPPGRSSLRSTLTTGTGASGEMRERRRTSSDPASRRRR